MHRNINEEDNYHGGETESCMYDDDEDGIAGCHCKGHRQRICQLIIIHFLLLVVPLTVLIILLV